VRGRAASERFTDAQALAMAEDMILDEIVSLADQDLPPADRRDVGALLLTHPRREVRDWVLRWLASADD
jgi:hypothetical protein